WAAGSQGRTAFREFGSSIDGVRLDNRKAAHNFLGFHKRPIGDDSLRVDDATFLGQRVATVEYPAFLQPLANPRLPLLHVLLHFYGRHFAGEVDTAAVNKEEFGHVCVPFTTIPL